MDLGRFRLVSLLSLGLGLKDSNIPTCWLLLQMYLICICHFFQASRDDKGQSIAVPARPPYQNVFFAGAAGGSLAFHQNASTQTISRMRNPASSGLSTLLDL